MAEEPKEEVQEGEASSDEDQGQKGSSKKIIVIAAAAVLLVGLTVTTALLLLGSDEANDPQGEEAATVANEASSSSGSSVGPAIGAPKFYNIRPAFIVNIPSQGRIRYLQIEVDIMTRQDNIVRDLEAYSPLIKNELVQLFSNQDYAALQAPEGREKLRKDALERVQKVMREQAGVEGVEQVLFTRFVTQ